MLSIVQLFLPKMMLNYFRFANVLDFGDVYRFSQNLILKELSDDKNLQKIGKLDFISIYNAFIS